MATQEELDWDNTVSKNKQRESRGRRKAEREVKDRRKALLQGASSTKDRRDIKRGVYDISTTSTETDNRQGSNSTINDNGVDSAISHSGSVSVSGGGLPDGFAEETLDVVDANNAAGQRVFLTKAV
tara:strand:+ start:1334 stop:1711 length:378 start_codon:yes stop_codon:yes gene_type:complete